MPSLISGITLPRSDLPNTDIYDIWITYSLLLLYFNLAYSVRGRGPFDGDGRPVHCVSHASSHRGQESRPSLLCQRPPIRVSLDWELVVFGRRVD